MTDLKAAVIGGGVIGGGWAARFLLNGWDVAIYDPDPEAERKIAEVLANARRALPALYDVPMPTEGNLVFCDDVAEAVSGADWIQESIPERLTLKHRLYAELSSAAPMDAVIGSSTSGFTPDELNGFSPPTAASVDARRVIVAHPFNPVYLLPLVELVGVPRHTEPAAALLRKIGMFPLTLRRPISAHIADRLLEAVWREALWLVHDDVASTEEIDEAIRMGFGLRWAQMGLFETYRIAGGEAGMAHFISQFGPALKWPWTKLTDVPELSDILIDKIARQSDAQSGNRSIRDLERQRDDNLVAILTALKTTRAGAGNVIHAHQRALSADPGQHQGCDEQHDAPLLTVARKIPAHWADYNGHVNEAYYLELSAQATDQFLERIGVDAKYVANGGSFFTLENHICYLRELLPAENVTVTTQLLDQSGKRLHLFHRLLGADGVLAATVESMLVHVDLNARRATEPNAEIVATAARFKEAHARLDKPEQVGRSIGSPRR